MKSVCSPSAAGTNWNKGLLNDLISPRKHNPVPNHILDTKIFSKLNQNAVVKLEPSVVHFNGFQLHKTQKCRIKICNSSSEKQNLHIIDPSTKYFSIRYTKPKRFVPGFTIDVVISFTPDEWRYYYDCIRIHCQSKENIIIPLHAYPVMDVSRFPNKLVFEPTTVSLGKSIRKVLPLKSHCPVDFEFQITIVQSHPALTVHPLSGVVSGEGEVSVVVTYTPSEYVTSHMTMHLNISQFNSKPLVCFVTASCSPKSDATLQKSVKELDEMYKQTNLFDPHSLSLVQISRNRRAATLEPAPKEIKYEGLHFPVEIHTQHAVNNVLIQKVGKLRAKDVREVVLSQLALKDGQASGIQLKQSPSRQMKEASFNQDVRKDEIEERANHLRWQVHLGHKPLNEQTHIHILRERERARDDYKYIKRNEPQDEKELMQNNTSTNFLRIFRKADLRKDEVASFDLYRNNPWLIRHHALERFQQAARTILIRKRADKKVKMLREMIIQFQRGMIEAETSLQNATDFQLDVRNPSTPGGTTSTPHPLFLMSDNRVVPFTFPTYVTPDAKDDIATDELGEIENTSSSILFKNDIPFHGLKVPKQYEVCGYTPADIHVAYRNYLSPTLPRQIRNGAEDEIIQVSIAPHLLGESSAPKNKSNQSLTSSVSYEKLDENIEAKSRLSSSGLIMPSGVLSNPPNHPLNIFNPFPAVQSTYLPFSQSVVDPDYHLCPIPRYTLLPDAQPFLDKQDTIKGAMAWKNFPSQALVTLSQTLLSKDILLMRWSNPFSEAMIPTIAPSLLQHMPEENDVNVQADDDSLIELTPEMIQTQFPLEESLLRSFAEEEEEQKQAEVVEKPIYNQVGAKIRTNLKRFENMDKKKVKIVYC